MPTMQPSTNYVVGEITDVQLANGDTVKAVVPTVNAQIAPGAGIATESKQDAIIAAMAGPSTGAVSSVASSATSVALLPANANRKGATIVNTDANPLKVLLSAGLAAANAYSHEILAGFDWEVPFGYTGAIFGIWDVDGAGSAIITELT